MPNAQDTLGTVFVNGTAAMIARVLGGDAQPIKQADVETIKYSIFLLDDGDPTARDAVEGHSAATLDAAAVVFDVLQTDAVWTVDQTGFNFLHTIDVTEHAAFAQAQKHYLVEYTIQPAAGQPIIVRFLISTI
jgi:hypothetical protein